MATKMDEKSTSQFIVTELIKFTENSLGLKEETAPQLILKPHSEKGALLFIPRNRKLVEEKLIQLILPQETNSGCQIFNFNEKLQMELVSVLNANMQQKFIHHYGLLYNQKICAIIGNTESNQLIKSCFNELATGVFQPDIPEYGYVIVNLKGIEDVVSDPNFSSAFSASLLDKTSEFGAMDKGTPNTTIGLIRNRAFSLALKNLICLHGNSVKLTETFEWRSMSEMNKMIDRICLACEKTGSMIKETDTKTVLKIPNGNFKNDIKSKEHQHVEILIRKKDGSYSKEVLLGAGLILHLMNTGKVAENDRIVFLFDQRLKDNLNRSLHLLCHLGFIKNRIDLIMQFGSKQPNSDPIAIMDARKTHIYQMLAGRCEEGASINHDEIAVKANELCELVTKFELLSHPSNQEVRLVVSNKVGTDHSMFVLYNYARMTQIIKKFDNFAAIGTYPPLPEVSKTDFTLLALDAEWHLIVNYVLKVPLMLSENFNYSPTLQPNCISCICKFLISLSQDFSAYYSKSKILTQPVEHFYPKMFARVHLLIALRTVMDKCFQVLDIKPYDQI